MPGIKTCWWWAVPAAAKQGILLSRICFNAEYSALLTKKKALYPEYRKARDEMQDIVKAQKNVELFFAEEKDSKEKEQIR